MDVDWEILAATRFMPSLYLISIKTPIEGMMDTMSKAEARGRENGHGTTTGRTNLGTARTSYDSRQTSHAKIRSIATLPFESLTSMILLHHQLHNRWSICVEFQYLFKVL